MLILSLLVILLPMGVGLFLWNQLPDQVPIHFGLNGQADNYAGKAFVVFGLPLLMAALQVLLLVVTMADPKGKNIAAKPFGLLLWICPLVSLFCGTVILAKALALPVDLTWWEVCPGPDVLGGGQLPCPSANRPIPWAFACPGPWLTRTTGPIPIGWRARSGPSAAW